MDLTSSYRRSCSSAGVGPQRASPSVGLSAPVTNVNVIMEMFSAFVRHLSYSHCPQISSVRRENLTLSSRESSLLRCSSSSPARYKQRNSSLVSRDQRAVLSASCGGCSSVFSPAVAALRTARARSCLRCRFPPALIARSNVNAADARAAGLSCRRLASARERSSSRYSRIVENKRDIQRDG